MGSGELSAMTLAIVLTTLSVLIVAGVLVHRTMQSTRRDAWEHHSDAQLDTITDHRSHPYRQI